MINIPEPNNEYTTNFLKGMSLFLNNRDKYSGVAMSPCFYYIDVYLAGIILTKEEKEELSRLGWVKKPECTWCYPEQRYGGERC